MALEVLNILGPAIADPVVEGDAVLYRLCPEIRLFVSEPTEHN